MDLRMVGRILSDFMSEQTGRPLQMIGVYTHQVILITTVKNFGKIWIFWPEPVRSVGSQGHGSGAADPSEASPYRRHLKL